MHRLLQRRHNEITQVVLRGSMIHELVPGEGVLDQERRHRTRRAETGERGGATRFLERRVCAASAAEREPGSSRLKSSRRHRAHADTRAD
ncbi:hypothetical protein AAFF_G00421650 [Aldrovandia affinis]|uniref:Uncharacterized protein n=1 Tax=Aldrovandia affinis TaxID=143900 RepID=A0AAD7WIY3_9TELE|nr:hypothetical protein AAFF_G00421650 [Aldrovandia affinis]